MGFFLARGGAILAIARHIEDRAQFLLQRQRLADQLLGPGIVIDRRNHGRLAFAFVEGVVGVHRRAHGYLPACWSCFVRRKAARWP